MAKIRGTSILGTFEYVREAHGDEPLRRAIAGLPEATRAALGDVSQTLILPNAWYDCAVVTDLTREVDRVCGTGDLAVARAIGKYVAFRDVNRFFKWLLRLTGPGTVFTRAASVWNNYYSGGRYVFEGVQGTRASIRIEDWDCANPVICARVQGWIERALELTLGRGASPVIREPAHLATDPALGGVRFCRYESEWG
jgi:hypothetical protein